METVAAWGLLAQTQPEPAAGTSGSGILLIIMLGALLAVAAALTGTVSALAAVAAAAIGGVFSSLRALVVVAGAFLVLIMVGLDGAADEPAPRPDAPSVQPTGAPGGR